MEIINQAIHFFQSEPIFGIGLLIMLGFLFYSSKKVVGKLIIGVIGLVIIVYILGIVGDSTTSSLDQKGKMVELQEE